MAMWRRPEKLASMKISAVMGARNGNSTRVTRGIDKNHFSERPEGSKHRHDAAGTREHEGKKLILNKRAGKERKRVSGGRMDEGYLQEGKRGVTARGLTTATPPPGGPKTPPFSAQWLELRFSRGARDGAARPHPPKRVRRISEALEARRHRNRTLSRDRRLEWWRRS